MVMTTIIQRSPAMLTDITPTFVVGYRSERIANNVVHLILGRQAPNVTLRPAALRTGTLTLLFDTADAAIYCEAQHAEGGVFTIYREDMPWATMAYVVPGGGRIVVELDTTRYRCTIDFQEVQP